jgi:hypothetical protein
MWERDGQTIIYHGGYKDGPFFIGRVNADGSDLAEIALPAAYRQYGHFTGSDTGLLVSDGYYQQDDDPEYRGGAWITLQKVDWAERSVEWIPICRHGSNWDSQDSHPHPIFNHGSDAVYFTSNFEGNRAVYRADVPDNI